MIIFRASHQRGAADHGWLKTRHTFSFGDYYDPEQVGFSDLLVINDDRIEGGKGFATHPHRDMEIFTYILEGALRHQDSMGTGSIIRPHDVQMMSAGRGILHSEFNALSDQPTRLLQIWVRPNVQSVTPRYHQVHVPRAEKLATLRLIIAPEGGSAGNETVVPIYQNTQVFATIFEANIPQSVVWKNSQNRWAFLQIARGAVEVVDSQGNGRVFREGDSARIIDETALTFRALTDENSTEESEFLLFELTPEK